MGNTWRTTLPVQHLIELIGPFEDDVWGVGGVTEADVEWALNEGRLSEENPCWNFGGLSTPEAHAERIAWLITHGWDPNEPLWVDVKASGVVSLDDGNHRLHALAYLGSTENVLVEIYGFIDVAEEVLGIRLEEEVTR